MTVYLHRAAALADGVAITTANSGNATDTAYLSITNTGTAGSTLTATKNGAAVGATSEVFTPVSGGIIFVEDDVTAGVANDAYTLEILLPVGASPGAAVPLLSWRNAAGEILRMTLGVDRLIRIYDHTNFSASPKFASTAAVRNDGLPMRIEVAVAPGTTTTTGSAQYAMYNDVTTTTPMAGGSGSLTNLDLGLTGVLSGSRRGVVQGVANTMPITMIAMHVTGTYALPGPIPLLPVLVGYTDSVPITGTSFNWPRYCAAGNAMVVFIQHGVTGTTITNLTDNSAGVNVWTKVRSTNDLAATSQRNVDVWVCLTPTVAITYISGTASAATSLVASGEDLLGGWILHDSNYYFGAGHTLTGLATSVGDVCFWAGAYVATTAGTPQITLPGWTYEGLNNSATTQLEQWKIPATSTTTGTQSASPTVNPNVGAVYLSLTPIGPPTLTGTVLATDSFTGANGAAPAPQWTVTLAGTTPGTAQIQSNKAVLTPGVGAYSAAVSSMWLSGAPAVSNQEWDILVTMVPDATLRQQYLVAGMSTNGSIRSGDTLPGNGYGVQLFPSSGGFNLNRITSGSVVNLMGANGTYTFTAGIAVNARIKMTGGNTISLWLWNAGTNMPTTPTWTGTDAAPLTGTLKPVLAASNGSATTAIPAGFDDFSFASAAATQGWFVYNGTAWVHHIANERTATPAWVPAPTSEIA